MSRFNRFLLAALIGLTFQFVAVSTAAGKQYIVSAGDSLSLIASIYDVTVGSIVDLNGIGDPNFIFPGQVLEIPGSAGGGQSTTYEVQAGDTLGGIAETFGVSVAELQSANGISNPDLIFVGQVLSVPSAEQASLQSSSLSLADRPYDPDLEAIMDEFAAYEGLDPGVVKAVAWVESGWQQNVVSPAGAVGLMQLMPGTATWLEDDIFGQTLNEDVSAYDNVKMGTRYLRILMNATGWDTEIALASYYQGHGITLSGIIYEETLDYVSAVLAVRDAYWP
ncbi:MAG: LysM peptidoglycan-binding domain-containing protein [Chloroflexi bacterium]|nr:LysM peptidoglycan-binding domain-containing protein [Chloroflexota bacterium]